MENTSFDEAIEKLWSLGINPDLIENDENYDYYKIPINDIKNSKKKVNKIIKKHTIIVDSRERDYLVYKNPNNYLLNLSQTYRNVEKIELIAVMLPKTEYNVNSNNNKVRIAVNGSTTFECYHLTPGQYMLGSNTYGDNKYIADGDVPKWGLLAEIKRVLALSGFSFNIFLCTVPYEYNNLTDASNGGTGKNASVLNRICITSETSFKIDFTNNNTINRLLGFPNEIIESSTNINKIYGFDDTGECNGTHILNGDVYTIQVNSIISKYDYNLLDDPNYLIMELSIGNNLLNRIESTNLSTDNKFCVVLYDMNDPDNIQSYNSESNIYNPANLTIDRKQGRLKALKGTDFDKKIINFNPPIIIENIKITFYKYGNILYDFNNREHLLIFEVDTIEQKSINNNENIENNENNEN